MAIFKYTLPSGAEFQLNAEAGTTQAQADKIFYEQVAAGTFVGYKKGDKLTHPAEALTNFGITRLQRGTAGVDDKTLLAIISGLPIVAPLPSLKNTPIQNPIDQTNYIQVTSSPTGLTDLGPNGVGQLSSTQTQALMAQIAATTQGNVDTITQTIGIGTYGFNCTQLEQVGLIKPGMCALYCPTDPQTGANPSNFVEFMNSPTPWTGLNGITSANDIVGDQATQNQIQEQLLQQSYNQLVANGTIVPPTPTVTTPSISTGQVYSSSGTLVATSALTLIASGLGYNGANALFSDFNNLFSSNSSSSLYSEAVSTLGSVGNSISGFFSSLTSSPVGDVPVDIQNLGTDAVAAYNSGLSSLSSGAVGFSNSTLSNISTATGSSVTQLSGLASGLTGGSVANTTAAITSTLNSDVGALLATSSKYGTSLVTAWADSAGSTLTSIGNNLGSLASGVSTAATNAFNTAQTSLSTGIDSLAKASQFSINFSDFSLSSLVAGVQPAAGFTNTVDRATVDAAVNRVIGSSLITPPTFELPSVSSLGTLADISAAKSILAQAQSAAQGVGSKIVNIV